MPDTIEDIKKRLEELDTLIRETEARLPAHSTKPPVMVDLLAYEDEYDVLLKKLNGLKNMSSNMDNSKIKKRYNAD